MKNHRIELGETPFVIRSDVDDVRIRRIEAFLNERFAEVRGRGGRIAYNDALVLVLFRLADMLLDHQDSSDNKRSEAARELALLRGEMDELDRLLGARIESSREEA